MNNKQKKELYESIMKDVSKIVKSQLNEGKLEFEELDFIGQTIKNMFEYIDTNVRTVADLRKGLKFVDIDFGIDMPKQLKQQVIKNSVGFFVEGIFTKMLMDVAKQGMNTVDGFHRHVNIVYNGNNALHDITMEIESNGEFDVDEYQVGEDIYGEEVDLQPGHHIDGPSRTFDFEIKAFNGKTGNITLTEKQREALNNGTANAYYMLVDYSLSGSLDHPGIKFNHLYILDSDDATNLITSKHINKNVLENAYMAF